MLELNDAQRAVLTDKLADVANLGVGALFFGQFLGERAFSLVLGLLGFCMWLLLTAFAIALAGGKQP